VPADLESSQQAILEALVTASPLAILTLDLHMRVTMWNPASERMFGWKAEEVLGKPYPLVPPDEWTRFEGFYATVISGQGFTGVEAVRSRKDGSTLHTAISTAPIRGPGGDVVGAMALLEDISERKILEEKSRQATKLEALGRLAGGVAHDFNNLLTVILAFSDSLLDTSDPVAVHRSAAAIRHAAERASDLTRQLLTFSRQQVLRTEVIDLNHTILDAHDMLRRLIGANILITLDLLSVPVWVRVDPSQVEQVLMNLAANARDAMPGGGTLAITTARVLRGGEPWVQVTVSDDGVGMDAQSAARVFDPFFTTKPVDKGTGLGLASVYGTIRQSGGEVDVETAPGRGTTFRITLPAAEPPDVAIPETGARDLRTPVRRSILIAEDDADVREVLAKLLESCGHVVISAEDGLDALAYCRDLELPIDLLITDVVMPNMGGGELARKLHAIRPGTPVLYVSGYADDEIVRSGVEAGGHFLQKPFSLRMLREAVDRALDSTPSTDAPAPDERGSTPQRDGGGPQDLGTPAPADLPIYLRDLGQGPPVLLIHGWMTTGEVYQPLVEGLLASNCRVLIPDLRGCGESGQAETYSIAAYVEDLVPILEDSGPAVIVGHSMGGAIAQWLAAAHPDLVRGLVLLTPVPASGVPLGPDVYGTFERSAGDAALLTAILDMATHTLTDADRATLVDLALTVDPTAMRSSLFSWTQGGFTHRLARIAVPTHVIATDDPFLPPEFLQEAVVDPIPQATLHHLSGSGHYPMWEDPAGLEPLMLSLLADLHAQG
jgi:two-component system cell cycle sensor histidine kinase/response regulator CckA